MSNADFFLVPLNRLKEALRVGKDKEVADALGMNEKTFNARKTRNSFPDAELQALAAARPDLGIDPLYVMTGVRSKTPRINLAASMSKGPFEPEGAPSDQPLQGADWNEFVRVPRYDIQASAGPGALVNDECIVDHLAFKRDWLVGQMCLDPNRAALIDVKGDSMQGTIDDGDLILLDTRPQNSPADGIYVINLRGTLHVKRLQAKLNGEIEVVSDNPRYGRESVSEEQLDQLQVVGRVVWQGRKL